MCDRVSSFSQNVGEQFSNVTTQIKNKFSDGCNYLARQIEHFNNETLPLITRKISELSVDLIKHFFWIVPYVALCLGHYGDAAATLLVSLVSGMDHLVQIKEFREAAAVAVGAPLAVNIAFKAVKLLTTGSSYYLVSIIFHFVCIAKLAMISRGQNY